MPVPEYLPQKYRPRVSRWDARSGKAVTITLRQGWTFPVGTHKLRVGTMRAAIAAMRSSIPCQCEACAGSGGVHFTGFCPDCGWKLDCLENTMHATSGVRHKRYACLVCGVTATVDNEKVTFVSGKKQKNQ